VVFLGELPFGVGQVGGLDRDDKAPVLAHRAALHPGHDQVEFLELDAGNPDRGEEVALTASHDRAGAEVIAETSPGQSCPRDNAGRDQDRLDRSFDRSPQHTVIMSPRRPVSGSRRRRHIRPLLRFC
jgi:hypothetical protein